MNELSFAKWKEQMITSAKFTKTPICATFELTPRCNLDCKMCYVHNQDSNALINAELPTEVWKRIFDEAYNSGMMFATLTGGECLLREDFKDLYLHLWNKRIYLTVFTNGTLLNEEYVAFFKTYKPKEIQISLYGSNEAGYLNVTGHRGFEKATSSIRNLMAAGISVRVAITPSSCIKNDYISVLRYCKENRFKYKPGEFRLINKRDGSGNNDYLLTPEEIVALSIERASLSKQLTPLNCELTPCGGSCTEAPKGLICNAGKVSAVVSWDGRMCLCTAIPVSKASVLEMSYAEAWEKNKEAAAEILLGAECVGCPYDELCPKCPAMRLTGLYTGHCDPNVCEVTRRLVAAGVKELPGANNGTGK